MIFKLKDRVVLLNQPFIVPTPTWPVWNSEHACIGTVIGIISEEVRHDGGSYSRIRVQWDNGERHTFNDNNLAHAGYCDTKLSKPNPNQAFQRQKKDRDRDKWEPVMSRDEYFQLMKKDGSIDE